MTVKERADAIGTFRFIEVWLMEMTACWTPLTPEMEAKVMFGRHIWDYAQHADWLGKRTFELRQAEHYTRTPAKPYVELLQSVRKAAETGERLALLYDVVVPGLASRYESYLKVTDSLLDGPTVLIIERILPELMRQLEDSRRLREELMLPAVESTDWRRREADIASVVA